MPELTIEEILNIDSINLYAIKDEDLLHYYNFLMSIRDNEDLWNDEIDTQFNYFEDELLIRGII